MLREELAPGGRGTSRGRRRVRRALLVALLATTVLALAAALGVLSLRLPAVQRALVDRALRTVRENAGVVVAVEGVSVDLLEGRATVRGVTASAPSGRPFLAFPTGTVTFDVRAALEGRVVVSSLEASGLTIDLGAPLPSPALSAPRRRGERLLPDVEIERFRIGVDSILSGPLPPAVQKAVLAVRAEAVVVEGSLRAGRLRLRVEAPSVVVDRPGPVRVALALRGKVELEEPDRLLVPSLSIEGDGFSLLASGSAGLGASAPLAGKLDATFEPELLAPEAGVSGRVTAHATLGGSFEAPRLAVAVASDGLALPWADLETVRATLAADRQRVDLTGLTAALATGGTLSATATVGLPGRDVAFSVNGDEVDVAVLAPFLPSGALSRWGLAGTLLRVEMAGRLPAGDPARLSADALLAARRGEVVLAEGNARLEAGGPVAASLGLDLLPGSAGRRTVAVRAVAPELLALADARLAGARAEVDVPDLALAWEELAGLFPGLVPAPPPGPDLSGPLHVSVEARGPLRRPDAELAARWEAAPGADVVALATWEGAQQAATAQATVSALPLSRLVPGASGVIWVDGRVSRRRGSVAGSVEVDAVGLCVASPSPEITALHLEGALDGDEVSVAALAVEAAGARLRATGRASLSEPLGDADLVLEAVRGPSSATATATVRDGSLALDVPRLALPGTEVSLAVALPLGALRSLALPPALASRLPRDAPDGLLFVSLAAPDASLCALEPLLAGSATLPAAEAGVALAAAIDLADPARSSAELLLTGLRVPTNAGRLEADGDLRLVLEDGRLSIPRAKVRGPGTRLALDAVVELDARRLAGGPLLDAVGSLRLSLDGSAEAALLDPYLAGGSASGTLEIAAAVEGRPGALRGSVSLRGPGAAFLWASPYATQLTDPDLALDLASLQLTRGTLRWNGGTVALSGGLAEGRGLDLYAEMEGVRYRLAYGLTATLGGMLDLELLGPDGRRLSGVVSVNRGVLTRDVDLDRELLTRLLAPPVAEGTEASFRDTLALDIDVVTESGVRVRNNLADLKASWSALSVTGTARSPVVRGRIDIEPGGRVFAYRQTFRIDRGTVTYAGDPSTDPRLDFVTTSSLSDPSIAMDREAELMARLGASRREEAGEEGEVNAASELARGLAGYYGDRLAAQLNQALGVVKVSLRPLLVFGETDPGTQLTVSRDVSRYVTLAFAVDLKNAQRQTYLLDVHGLRGLPPVSAQVFTNDAGSYGGTLQQRIELGGSRPLRTAGETPRAASVSLEAPAEVSRGRLLRAVRIAKGEPVDAGALFDAEIDAEAALNEQGFPAAKVAVSTAPSPRKAGRVDVTLRVEPGPRAEVVFEGDAPAAAFRGEIRALYRPGPLEPTTLDEMQAAAVRAFRTAGHVEPDVSVSAAQGDGLRRVTVRSVAGPRSALTSLVLPGAPPAEAAVVAARLASPLARAELAAGVPSADARLLGMLAALGFPNALLVSRDLAADGRTLSVGVDPGRPSLVDSVTVEGLLADEAARLRALVPVLEEQPARTSRIAEGAVLIEDDLASLGHAGASVRTVVAPASPEDPPRLAVTYVVDPGVVHTVGAVRFVGLRSSREKTLERVAALTPGAPYRRADVDEARSRLYGLGLFSSVRAEPAKASAAGLVDVSFLAEEAPRFSIAYGLRWENEYGTGVVLDAVDRNLLGRGLTLGVRALYDPNDREGRLYLAVPGVLASKVTLEAFVGAGRERRDKTYGTRVTDLREATLQLSRPVGPRLTGRLYGRYQLTDIFEPTDDPDFPFEVTVRLPYAGTQLVYDSREDPVLGTRGLLASLDLQASGSFLGSDYAFGRVYGQVNSFFPVGRLAAGPVVWAQSVRAGFAKGFEGQEVIPDVRFFAGGQYSVRGYATDELGPREELGDESYAVGGTSLFVLNEELRVPLHPRLQGIAFVDVGQAWASARDFLTDLAPSAGLGLRAITPVGVLRLDAAVPLRPKEWDPRLKLYFGFGNVF